MRTHLRLELELRWHVAIELRTGVDLCKLDV
jgi:hypothetical protein